MAELLALTRQAQYKADQLEQDAVRERNELAVERENLLLMKESIDEQAQQRHQAERLRLRVGWTAGLTFVSIILFGLMVVLQVLFSRLTTLPIALSIPPGICVLLSYVFAQMYASGRFNIKPQTRSQKAPEKTGKQTKASAK